MDAKYLKSPETLDRENRELRNILRRLTELDAQNCQPDTLAQLQDEARSTLSGMDRRRSAAGFTRPEIQGKASALAREQQAAFLAQVGPVLKELHGSGMSMRAMAEALNARSIAAPKGGAWAPGSVKYQLDALARIEAARP